jgi:hypothetical protein
MDSDAREREIAAHYRMLKETARRPELPANSLGQGPDADGEAGPRIVRQFNTTVQRLEALDAVPHGMFAELAEDSGWAGMYIAHEQLAAFIQPEAGGEREEEDEVVRPDSGSGPFVLNFRPYLAPDTDAADIGALVREVAPKEVRAAWKFIRRVGDASEPGEAEEVASQMEAVAERLSQEGITPEEISRAAAELRELAARQADLACEEHEIECCVDE